MKLVGVGVAFARVPFAEFAFATFEGTFAELEVLKAFAVLTVFCEPFVTGELRGVLPGVVVGFVLLEAATNNPAVTEGNACVAVFPSEPFACGFVAVLLLPGGFDSLPASTPLRSENGSSWY